MAWQAHSSLFAADQCQNSRSPATRAGTRTKATREVFLEKVRKQFGAGEADILVSSGAI